jgi:hypothetical protein
MIFLEKALLHTDRTSNLKERKQQRNKQRRVQETGRRQEIGSLLLNVTSIKDNEPVIMTGALL